MNYSWKPIKLEDTSFYKGVGMLLIAFHNFFHWVSPSVGENEFHFNPDRISNLWNKIAHTPSETINLLFSYFGHFGVQIFIFLSGYGLMIAYENRKITWPGFVIKRINKLYPALVISIVILILLRIYQSSALPSELILNLYLLKLSFLSNLFPRMALSVNGPWWFYSLIVQLYIVFPGLLWVHKKMGKWGLWLIIGLSYLAFFYWYESFLVLDLNILYLFVGHLPEFVLGMILARHVPNKLTIVLFPVAIIVFILGNYYSFFWYFSFLAITYIFIIGLQPIQQLLRKLPRIYNFVVFFGVVSMYTFAIHGFLRDPLYRIANEIGSGFSTILIAVIFVTVSTIIGMGIRSVEFSYKNFKSNVAGKWNAFRQFLSQKYSRNKVYLFVLRKENTQFVSYVFLFFGIDVFLRIYGINVLHFFQSVSYNSWFPVLKGIYSDIALILSLSLLAYIPVLLILRFSKKLVDIIIAILLFIWSFVFIVSVNNMAIHISGVSADVLYPSFLNLIHLTPAIIFAMFCFAVLVFFSLRFFKKIRFRTYLFLIIVVAGLISIAGKKYAMQPPAQSINYLLKVNPVQLAFSGIGNLTEEPHKNNMIRKNAGDIVYFYADFENLNDNYYSDGIDSAEAFSGNLSYFLKEEDLYGSVLEQITLPQKINKVEIEIALKFKSSITGAHHYPYLIVQIDSKDKNAKQWLRYAPFNNVLKPNGKWSALTFKQTIDLKPSDKKQKLKVYFLNGEHIPMHYDDLLVIVRKKQ